MAKKYKKHDPTWIDFQDPDYYDDDNSFDDDTSDKSVGDNVADFIENTYGLGIVLLAVVVITIPLAVIFGIQYLIDLFATYFR